MDCTVTAAAIADPEPNNLTSTLKRDHEQRSQQARFDREEPNMMKKAQPLGLEYCYQTEYELRGTVRQSSPLVAS